MWFFDYEYLKEEFFKDIDSLFLSFLSNMLESFVTIAFVMMVVTLAVLIIYGLSCFHIIDISTIANIIK